MFEDMRKSSRIIKLPGVKIVSGPGMFIIKTLKTLGDVEEISHCCKHHIEEDVVKYTVKIELPGVKREDIKLYVSENAISLNAKPSIKMPWTPETYRFKVNLANSIDNENVKAKYQNGILIVELPKKRVPKKVKVE